MRLVEVTTREDVSNQKRRFLVAEAAPSDTAIDVANELPALHSECELFPGMIARDKQVSEATYGTWTAEVTYGYRDSHAAT